MIKRKRQPLNPEKALYDDSDLMPSAAEVGRALGISRYHVLRLCEELGDLPVYDTSAPQAYHPTWRIPRETFVVIYKYLKLTERSAQEKDRRLRRKKARQEEAQRARENLEFRGIIERWVEFEDGDTD